MSPPCGTKLLSIVTINFLSSAWSRHGHQRSGRNLRLHTAILHSFIKKCMTCYTFGCDKNLKGQLQIAIKSAIDSECQWDCTALTASISNAPHQQSAVKLLCKHRYNWEWGLSNTNSDILHDQTYPLSPIIRNTQYVMKVYPDATRLRQLL